MNRFVIVFVLCGRDASGWPVCGGGGGGVPGQGEKKTEFEGWELSCDAKGYLRSPSMLFNPSLLHSDKCHPNYYFQLEDNVIADEFAGGMICNVWNFKFFEQLRVVVLGFACGLLGNARIALCNFLTNKQRVKITTFQNKRKISAYNGLLDYRNCLLIQLILRKNK